VETREIDSLYTNWQARGKTMAPRQRLSPPPSMEDLSSAAASSSAEGPSSSLGSPSDRRPLLSSAGESKLSSSFGSSQAPTEADVARERHDFFNLVALVRIPPFIVSHCHVTGPLWLTFTLCFYFYRLFASFQ
jgi:hypothetical protein